MRSFVFFLVLTSLLCGCASFDDASASAPSAENRAEAAAVADAALAIESAEPIDPLADAVPDADATANTLEADRASWPTIVVHPEDGRVSSRWAFFRGRRIRTLEGINLAELTPEERVDLALEPTR